MSNKVFAIVMLAALLGACATGEKPRSPAPSPPAAAPAPARPEGSPSVSVNSLEQKVIQATNAFRTENKLSPLKPSVQLIVVAQNHARNMAKQDRFGDSDKNGHILDGRHFEDRIKVSGYLFAHVAENVGYQLNKPDPAAAMMQDWKNSTGHRRNMLIDELTEIGVGAAQGKSGRWYFVQVFGRPQPPIKQGKLDWYGAAGW
jgi:uncharacterized protein YkwD